ncbi:MAG: Omp28-related outer membrane protein, partial [Candidatus Kapaibacterium sp.]
MKKMLLAVLAGTVLCTLSALAQQPVKRVLVEEFTGAWCPWCIDGPVRLDAIHDKVGDLMIPVAIHDNDSMTTTEYNQSWKPMAPFFPAGMVNRVFYSDETSKKVGIDRGNWEKRTMEELAKPAVCDVTISKPKFSAATRELSVTVDASFVTDVTGDVRLNAYIVEDKVVGKGTGWDQANAYNKLAGNESHPWYGKGSPVVGFEHNHVFRRAMGGAWGMAGSVPAGIKSGTKASYTFTTTVPGNWNPDNLVIVGIVQVYNSDVNKCEILNAVAQQSSPAPTVVASMASLVVAASNESAGNTGAIINQTDGELTYVITAEKSARTPADWTASSSVGNEITVPSRGRADISATLTVGATPGVGDAFLKVTVKSDPTQVYSTQKTTAIHKDCATLEILTESDQYSVAKSIAASNRQGYWPVAASAKVMKELLKLSALKTVVLNTGDAGTLSADPISTLQVLLDGGTSMLITGNKSAAPLANNQTFAAEAGINQVLEVGYGVNSTGGFVNFAVEGSDE